MVPSIVRRGGGVRLPPELDGVESTTAIAASNVASVEKLISMCPALVNNDSVRCLRAGVGAGAGAGAGVGAFFGAAFLGAAFLATDFFGAAFFLAAGFALLGFFAAGMVITSVGDASITGCRDFWFDTVESTSIELLRLVLILPRNVQALGSTV